MLDEWAHTFDPEAIWAAVEPTLAPRATSALITTARSPGDFVHGYYVRSEAGETRHTPVFVSALERPDRSLAWLEQKRREEGKVRSMRNYPLSVEEAFADASEPYFAPSLSRPPNAMRCHRRLRAGTTATSKPGTSVARMPASALFCVRHPGKRYRLARRRLQASRRSRTSRRSSARSKAKHADYPGPTIIEATRSACRRSRTLNLAATRSSRTRRRKPRSRRC